MQQQLSLFDDYSEPVPDPTLRQVACIACGTTFFSKRRSAKYCSTACRTEAAKSRRLQTQEVAAINAANIIRFPGTEALPEGEIDASLLAQFIQIQRTQIENQQRLIELLQSTLATLATTQAPAPARPPSPRYTVSANDDLLPLEVKDATTPGESSQNFINSMFNL